MKNCLCHSALLIWVLATGCGGSTEAGNSDSADVGGARTVAASQDDRLDMLDVLWKVHHLSDPRGATVRLFETGGGDPAINGNILVLTVLPPDLTFEARTWETGIDVRAIISVVFDEGTGGLVIETTSDTIDEDGGVGSIPRQFSLSWDVDDDGQIGDRLRVAANGEPPAEIAASIEPRHGLLSQIVDIRVDNDEPNAAAVRLYETGGGDPALNGDILLFNVMPFDPSLPSQSWETEINVRTVTDVRLDAAASTLHVRGRADVLDQNGDVDSVERAFALTYDVAEDGTVGNKLAIEAR